MISSLTGTVQSHESNLVTLAVNGVGYEVFCTLACLSNLVNTAVAQQATVLIYTDIKEDSIRLYGFADRLEKQIFLLLIRVNGVGAKTACDVLSRIDKRELLRLVAEGNVTQLQKIKGIGKKTAERIVLELKDIMLTYSREQTDILGAAGVNGAQFARLSGSSEDEALQALMALGLQARDAQAMLKRAVDDLPGLLEAETAEIIKAALKYI